MGRQYSGDINRKIWFGVQNSDAADRFGVIGYTPSYLEYNFELSDLDTVLSEIETITLTIGIENIEKLDNFFNKVNGYNDDIMTTHGVLEIWKEHKSDYADLKLGIDIKDCIIKNGSCSFDAEI